MAFRVILSSALMAVAFGIPLPQETPADTQRLPNIGHFAPVVPPVVLAPQPNLLPAVAPAPAVVHSHVIPPNIQKIIDLHRAELTPFDLKLADPATHTHPYGAHPGLPIHPGYDKPHSHAPFTAHPVIDMVTGAIVSEPLTPAVNQVLRLAPIPAPVAPVAPLTGTLAPIAPIVPAVANPVVNAPKVVGVEESPAVVETNVAAAPVPASLPFARFPVPVAAPIPVAAPAPVAAPLPAAPIPFGARVAQPVVLAPQPTAPLTLAAAPVPVAPVPVPAPAPIPAFNFAPAPAVVQPPKVVDVEQTPGKIEVEVAAVPVPVHPVPVHPVHPVHHPVHHAPAHVVHHSAPGHYHVQSHGAPLHHAPAVHHAVHHAPAVHHAVHHAPAVHHAVHHAPAVHHAVHHAPAVHHAVHHAPAVHHAVHHAPAVHHAVHHPSPVVHHAVHHPVHHAPAHYSHAGYEHRKIAAPAESKTYAFKIIEKAEEDRDAKAIDEVSANLENAIIEEAPEQELLDDLVAEEVVLEETPEEEIVLEEFVLEEAPIEESAPIEEDLEEAPSTEQSPVEE